MACKACAKRVIAVGTTSVRSSAFAGYQYTVAAYREAVSQKYRFFSYGDAMFINHNPHAAQEIVVSHDQMVGCIAKI